MERASKMILLVSVLVTLLVVAFAPAPEGVPGYEALRLFLLLFFGVNLAVGILALFKFGERQR